MTADPTRELLPPGQPIDLDNCAREPIHTPGAVQPHGAVLVARASDRVVTQLSANVHEIVGLAASEVIGHSLDELFGADAADRLVLGAEQADGPAVRPDRMAIGEVLVDTHGYVPAPGLIGVDVEPADETIPSTLSVIARVSTWAARLQAAKRIEDALSVAARALRDLTGFDRAWAYRFADDDHGIIVAEDRRDDLESFLGLHFPESDIPRQARDLYLRNGARVIVDSHAVDAALLPIENPETGAWLDLSASGLRAVSPMHIRYLRNMGVRSSMSVPVVVEGRLWGLLSAHAYEAPRAVPIRVRAECEMLGALTSMQLATTSELERATERLELGQHAATLAERLTVHDSLIEGLAAVPEALLGLCRASGAIIAIGGERATVGQVPDAAGVERLLAALAGRTEEVVATDQLGAEAPALAHLSDVASGVLAFPLARSRGNWVIWLRGESVHEVTWGNRDKQLVVRDPSGALQLGHRESFERWAEQVSGASTPWTPAEVEAVRALRASVGTLLIARTERLARLNDDLERSNAELDAFAYAAAHDLREPVRGIEQFAGFLAEDFSDVLGDEGREQIATILRLAHRMDALLSTLLVYAEIGESKWQRSTVDLQELVGEIRELLAARWPAEATLEVQPMTVEADVDGLRQLLLNLIWNALKYADGPARIEIGSSPLSEAEAGRPRARRSLLRDDEPVALYVRDHGIGIPAEHHEDVFTLFRRLHAREAYGGGHGAGLTLARRVVERHGGVIWIDAAPEEGTTVYFTLEPA